MKLSKQLKRELRDKGWLTLVAEVATLITGCVSIFILMIVLGSL